MGKAERIDEMIEALADDKQMLVKSFLNPNSDEVLPAWSAFITLSDLLHIPPWEVERAMTEHPEWVARAIVLNDAKNDAIQTANRRAQLRSRRV